MLNHVTRTDKFYFLARSTSVRLYSLSLPPRPCGLNSLPNGRGKTVALGISGGVDSAVSAILLKQKGYNVTGFFIRSWDPLEENSGTCNMDSSLLRAQSLCARLSIPFRSMNLVSHYWNNVFDPFLRGIEKGVVPNPDLGCNEYVKFGAFFDRVVKERGNGGEFDFVATGHYAIIRKDRNGRHRLCRANDKIKDQSFFLSRISPSVLPRVLFPVGQMLKSNVKHFAREHGLHDIADAKESTGICFIGKRSFGDFIDEYIQPLPGNIVTPSGHILATHQGLGRYTIGQRARILHPKGTRTERWYVAQKRTKDNTLVVVNHPNHPMLFSSHVKVGDFSEMFKETLLTNKKARQQSIRVFVKVRHAQSQPSRGYLVPESLESEDISTCWNLYFLVPEYGLCPGQHITFYDVQENCLGGCAILE